MRSGITYCLTGTLVRAPTTTSRVMPPAQRGIYCSRGASHESRALKLSQSIFISGLGKWRRKARQKRFREMGLGSHRNGLHWLRHESSEPAECGERGDISQWRNDRFWNPCLHV